MANKVGRSGAGRKAHGSVRAQILPTLKHEVERLSREDPRWRSVSHLIETAVGFFLSHLQASQGRVDQYNHPVIDRHPVSIMESPPKKHGSSLP